MFYILILFFIWKQKDINGFNSLDSLSIADVLLATFIIPHHKQVVPTIDIVSVMAPSDDSKIELLSYSIFPKKKDITTEIKMKNGHILFSI